MTIRQVSTLGPEPFPKRNIPFATTLSVTVRQSNDPKFLPLILALTKHCVTYSKEIYLQRGFCENQQVLVSKHDLDSPYPLDLAIEMDQIIKPKFARDL